MLCLNLIIIPNIIPGGLFFGGGGAYTRKEFSKLVSKHPGAYIQWDFLSEFYGSQVQFNLI